MPKKKRKNKTDVKEPSPLPPSGEGQGVRASDSKETLRPWLLGGAMTLVVARPLFPSEAAAAGDGLPVVMLWITLAVVWMLWAVGRPTFRVRWNWTDVAVIILIVFHGIAALLAASRGHARPAVNMLWQWVGLGLGFLLIRQFLTTAREARAAVALMLALSVALSGYGLYQYVWELPRARAAYAENPDEALREAGLWYPPGSPGRQLFESRLGSTEPIATFALTNSLAAYLAPWLIVAVGIGVYAMGQRRWGTVAATSCVALPVSVCLLLTQSRAAWLATLGGLALVALACTRAGRRLGWKWPTVGTAAVLVLLVVILGVGGRHNRVLAEAAKSLGYRIQYWQSTLSMIVDHPLWGCGPGQFQDAYTRYKLPEASEEIADPHNFLFEIWATAGTPTALAFLGVLGCFGWSIWKKGGTESPHESSPETMTGDATGHLCWGGLIGFFLSWPLGLMSSAPAEPASLAVGLPLAAGTLLILARWIRGGALPRAIVPVGVAVLLVNLLAAGGIGFPGVAGTFWLLLALGLRQEPGTQAAKREVLEATRPAAVAGLVGTLVMLFACYRTAYEPVLRAQAAIRLAQIEPRAAQAHLHQAASADPLSAAPWQYLASLAFQRWQAQPNEKTFRQFEHYTTEAAERAPDAAPAWLARGDRYLEAYLTGKPPDPRRLECAVEYYRRAVELYPHNGVYRAKLALALRVAGDEDGAKREAKKALELDALTPHLDKKLPEELRKQLIRKDFRA